MGAHKQNPTALLHQSAPAAQRGMEMQAEIVPTRAPKLEILLLPPSHVREGVGGLEVLIVHPPRVEGGQLVKSTEEAWGPVPPGRRVHRMGEPLLDADLDMVHMVVSRIIDTSLVVAVPGGGEGHRFTQVILGEFHRMDLREFQALHERQKRA